MANDGYRLSPQQRRLVRLGADSSSAFTAHIEIVVPHDVAADEIRSGLNALVAEYEILRTTFRTLSGMTLPVQVIDEAPRVAFRTLDLTELGGSAEAETEARQSFRAQALGTSDGPTIEAWLLALPGLDRRLLLKTSSLCADRETLLLISQRLDALLLAKSLPADAPQFADIAEWQHELLGAPEGEAGQAFWRDTQSNNDPSVRLPLEAERSDSANFVPRTVVRSLPNELLAQAKGLASEKGVPVGVVFEASWRILLGRLCEVESLVVGVYDNGRSHEELSDALGPCGRYLPVATSFGADTTASEFLLQLQGARDEATNWVDVFDWERMSLGSSAGEPAGFLSFGFDCWTDMSVSGQDAGHLRVAEVCSIMDRFKVLLEVHHGPACEFALCYDAGVLSSAAADTLAEQYEAVLAGVLSDPTKKICDLEVVGPEERHRLVHELNDTRTKLPLDRCVHQLIAEQVRRVPDALAADDGDDTLSYRELDRRANQLANRLRKLGVGPEIRVGICVERSVEMAVAILGVLKAGGCYVPLDPAYPSTRLDYMLSDSSTSVLLVQSSSAQLLSSPSAHVLCVDADRAEIDVESEDPPTVGVSPDNAVYVIYTSGSAGRPKGVVVTHSNLVNSTFARCEYFADPVQAFLLLASFSFDSSVAGIFWTLCQGGLLAIPGAEIAKDPDQIIDWIVRLRVSHLTLLPSVYGLILQHAEAGQLVSLRAGYVGGEACPESLVEAHYAALPDVPLYHAYGPTENTVWSTVCRVDPLPGRKRVPVGNPISNVRAYVVDEEGRIAPTGVAGELWLGGSSLARGYLGRPDATADAFVPDPFSGEPGDRLYRTGDLARRLSDGDLEFVGREDDQVKVRGYRIELGEIEAALAQHPLVSACAVAVRESDDGGKTLAAYYCPVGVGHSANGDLYLLPNRLGVEHFDKQQTDSLYRQIFDDETYLRHGVAISDGDCIFDIGANIGLFTLFASDRAADLRIVAFEPLPPTFERLKKNVEHFGLPVELFNAGVSDGEGSTNFTFYPNLTGMSGMYADRADDERLSRAALEGLDQSAALLTDEIVGERLESREYNCSLCTVSSTIRKLDIERIDLLKIDAEKAELDVLNGIDDEDWPKIRQIVAEVHDIDGRLSKILRLLRMRGFEPIAEQDLRLQGTALYTVYAVRSGELESSNTAGPGLLPRSETLEPADLKEFLSAELPAYMVPSSFTVLSALPQLPNGKVDRKALSALEDRSRQGEVRVPETERERILAELWKELLRLDAVGIDDNFFELGGDSILSIRLVSKARERGVWLTPSDVFQKQTITELAAAATEPPRVRPDQGPVLGEVLLTPIQSWFFEQGMTNPDDFSMAVSLDVSGGDHEQPWREAVHKIVEHHDSLHLRFEKRGVEWNQYVADLPSDSVLELKEFDSQVDDQWADVLIDHKNRRRRSLHLEGGPICRFVLFLDRAQAHSQLFIVVHHLAIDVVSWQILLDDLQSAYGQADEGQEITLPEKTDSYQRWAQAAAKHIDAANSEADYWRSVSGDPIPIDHESGENLRSSTAQVVGVLGPDETRRLLGSIPGPGGLEMDEVLIAALAMTLRRWNPGKRCYLDVEAHGRDEMGGDIDVSRTVGWFTAFSPVSIDLGDATETAEMVDRVIDQMRGIPAKRIGYGLLRYLHPDAQVRDSLRAIPEPEVTLNYLGQLDDRAASGDQLFEFSASATSRRRRLLEFNLYLSQAQLHLEVEYSENYHDRSTMENLSRWFLADLEVVGEHFQSTGSSAQAPSAFQDFSWGEQELADIAAVIEESQEGV